jgi:hypothetical protein
VAIASAFGGGSSLVDVGAVGVQALAVCHALEDELLPDGCGQFHGFL